MNFDNHEKRTVAYRFRVENGLQILFTQYKTGFTVTLTVFSLFFLSFFWSVFLLSFGSIFFSFLFVGSSTMFNLGHHVLFIRSNLYWLYSGRQWGFGAGWFTPVIFDITMYKPLPQNSSSLFSFLFFSFWLNWSDFNNLKCKKMLQYI